jgi:isocitrate dehydrogenase (NAD+)
MQQVTLIPGDGIGPEIAAATLTAVEATGARIRWEEKLAGAAAVKSSGSPLPESTLASIRNTRVALKGPLAASLANSHRSVGIALRQEFDLFANVRPVRSIEGIPSRYERVDLAVIRENTQGFYSGIEHSIDRNTAESIAVITRDGSERVIRYAFEYARAHKRRRVTLVHKANVLKLTSGLFLEVGREVSRHYPRILFEDMVVDNLCHLLVRDPMRFEVIVTTNLFGDIIADLSAGLVGGLGVTPGANIGEGTAIFEAVHGTASDIAGKGLANPTAMMLAAAMLLEHLSMRAAAARLRGALTTALRQRRVRTPDMGGMGDAHRFTEAVVREIRKG